MRRARIAGAIVTAGTLLLLADVVRVAWLNLEERVEDLEELAAGIVATERYLDARVRIAERLEGRSS